MWQQLSGDEAAPGQRAGGAQLGMVAWRDTTVEDLVAIVQRLPPREPVVPAVMHGLYYQDSRGLTAMLKELFQSRHGQKANLPRIRAHYVLKSPSNLHAAFALRRLYYQDSRGLAAMLKKLSKLYYQDSRGLAAMLKELSKSGHGQQALELFDWLQNLPANHDLAPLADVFSYTTAISLCGGLRKMDFAVDLLWKMRQRGIACNVHTYSCLMNVCIKNNDLDMALNADGLQANIVTFNTLIDAMGKAGRWQDAVGVLDIIDQQGVEPEARTFNTIIIACNLCGQPLQALEVYKKMCCRGIEPTDTTFTALISAYAKAERLEEALAAYKIMISEGHRRNAITYTALICGAEKAGAWRLALELFRRVAADGVAPNAAIFNAAMAACAQGGQALEARRIYAAMKEGLCRPDALTLTSLATAYQRAGKPDWAEQVLDEVVETRGRPDAALYATIIEGLWAGGPGQNRARAARRFNAALQASVHGLAASISGSEASVEMVVPTLAPGATLLALHHVLSSLQSTIRARSLPDLSRTLLITLGRSQRSPREGRTETLAVQQAALDFLSSLNCPCRQALPDFIHPRRPWVVPDSMPKQLQAGLGAFVEWLMPLNIDAAVGFDCQPTQQGSQDLNLGLLRFEPPRVSSPEAAHTERGGAPNLNQALSEKGRFPQAGVLSESGSLHSLPARSYLAKPFEPPCSSTSIVSRNQASAQTRVSAESAHAESTTRTEAPASAAEQACITQTSSPAVVPMPASEPAAGSQPQSAITAGLQQLLQPWGPGSSGFEALESPFRSAEGLLLAPPSALQLGKCAALGPATEGLAAAQDSPSGDILKFPTQHNSDLEFSKYLTGCRGALSMPEMGGPPGMSTLRKSSSPASARDLEVTPAALPCPQLPSPQPCHSWPPGLGSIGQPQGNMGAADPALQAKLVGMLEALGMNQRLPLPYGAAPMDSAQQFFNTFGDYSGMPGLPGGMDASSLAELGESMGALPKEASTPDALFSDAMAPFSALMSDSSTDPAYSMAGGGPCYLPGMGPAPGRDVPGPSHHGTPALPPEQVAAWQAAWMQQPLSAGSHAYHA